jgi:hypothetical protein
LRGFAEWPYHILSSAGNYDGDRFGTKAAYGEGERLEGALIKPMDIVEYEQEGLIREPGKEGQGRQSDQESVRGIFLTNAECAPERRSLSGRQPLELRHRWPEQLVQPCKSQL